MTYHGFSEFRIDMTMTCPEHSSPQWHAGQCIDTRTCARIRVMYHEHPAAEIFVHFDYLSW